MPLRAAAVGTEEREAAAASRAVPAPRRPWPDAVAYREAIQDPAAALADPDLAAGTVRADRRGLPVAYTGRFAVVFRLRAAAGAADGGAGEWAVRCFTSPDASAGSRRAAHYAALQEWLERLRAAGHPAARAFVPFRYVPAGVRVGGERFPLLAMRWAEGDALLGFVERHLGDPAALTRLCAALGSLLADLESARAAHGDWQHDNLLVTDGGRRVTLVDYDGVLLPDRPAGEAPAPERGHPNYQHPSRTAGGGVAGGGSPDRFSCHVLQTALLALAADPTLWETFGDGDSLLFKASDLLDPELSPVFGALRLVAFSDPALAASLSALEAACRAGSLADVPPPPAFEPAPVPAAALPVRPHETEAWSAAAGALSREWPAETERSGAVEASGFTERARLRVREAHAVEAHALRRERQYLWVVRVTLLYGATLIGMSVAHGDAFVVTPAFLLGVFWLFGCYLLWPTSRAATQLLRALQSVATEEQALRFRSADLRRQLREMDAKAANASPVAFVGAALAGVDGETLLRELAVAGADDARAMRRAGIGRLSDAAGEALTGLPEGLRGRLLRFREAKIREARAAYEQVAARRRGLRRERDALEAEWATVAAARDEVTASVRRVGDPGLGRFLGRVLGLRG